MTDAGQNPTDSLLFDAFGVQQYKSGTTPTPYGFAGAEGYQRDVDSGLMLCGHRYYNPATGRFLSSDPVGSGDNWYAYCDNDLLSAADPLPPCSRCWCSWAARWPSSAWSDASPT